MVAKIKAIEIEELLTPIFNEIKVELVDVEYRMENKDQMLRVFIDREIGVDLGLCTDVTKSIKKFLDEKNIEYDHLEVSSPGLNRIIKKHQNPSRFIGEQVKVKTLKSFTGPKNIVGILQQVNNETITIVNNDDNYNIPWEAVTTLRLHPDFN